MIHIVIILVMIMMTIVIIVMILVIIRGARRAPSADEAEHAHHRDELSWDTSRPRAFMTFKFHLLHSIQLSIWGTASKHFIGAGLEYGTSKIK